MNFRTAHTRLPYNTVEMHSEVVSTNPGPVSDSGIRGRRTDESRLWCVCGPSVPGGDSRITEPNVAAVMGD